MEETVMDEMDISETKKDHSRKRKPCRNSQNVQMHSYCLRYGVGSRNSSENGGLWAIKVESQEDQQGKRMKLYPLHVAQKETENVGDRLTFSECKDSGHFRKGELILDNYDNLQCVVTNRDPGSASHINSTCVMQTVRDDANLQVFDNFDSKVDATSMCFLSDKKSVNESCDNDLSLNQCKNLIVADKLPKVSEKDLQVLDDFTSKVDTDSSKIFFSSNENGNTLKIIDVRDICTKGAVCTESMSHDVIIHKDNTQVNDGVVSVDDPHSEYVDITVAGSTGNIDGKLFERTLDPVSLAVPDIIVNTQELNTPVSTPYTCVKIRDSSLSLSEASSSIDVYSREMEKNWDKNSRLICLEETSDYGKEEALLSTKLFESQRNKSHFDNEIVSSREYLTTESHDNEPIHLFPGKKLHCRNGIRGEKSAGSSTEIASPPITDSSSIFNQNMIASSDKGMDLVEADINYNFNFYKKEVNPTYQTVLKEKNKLETQAFENANLIKTLQKKDRALEERKELSDALQCERERSLGIREAADRALLVSEKEISVLREENKHLSKTLTEVRARHSVMLKDTIDRWKQKLHEIIKERDSLRGQLGELEFGRLLLQKELNLSPNPSADENFLQEIEALKILNKNLWQKENDLKAKQDKLSQLENSFLQVRDVHIHKEQQLKKKSARKLASSKQRDLHLREQIDITGNDAEKLKTLLGRMEKGKIKLRSILGIETYCGTAEFEEEIRRTSVILERLKVLEQKTLMSRKTSMEKEVQTQILKLPIDVTLKQTKDAAVQVILKYENVCNDTEVIARLEADLEAQRKLGTSLENRLAVKEGLIRNLVKCLQREYNDTLVDYEELMSDLVQIADESRRSMKKLEDLMKGQAF
ncbi:hypothetical protein SK128_027699 [Halocaridina rubra]|uniref:Uncharacterized protein n=1 Tax=Halocaridina rubra TaxID=373956 RepID=A0AAN8ZS64_HALRR